MFFFRLPVTVTLMSWDPIDCQMLLDTYIGTYVTYLNNCISAIFFYPFVRSVVEYQTHLLMFLILFNIDLSI